jgi:hypothetical protein
VRAPNPTPNALRSGPILREVEGRPDETPQATAALLCTAAVNGSCKSWRWPSSEDGSHLA